MSFIRKQRECRPNRCESGHFTTFPLKKVYYACRHEAYKRKKRRQQQQAFDPEGKCYHQDNVLLAKTWRAWSIFRSVGFSLFHFLFFCIGFFFRCVYWLRVAGATVRWDESNIIYFSSFGNHRRHCGRPHKKPFLLLHRKIVHLRIVGFVSCSCFSFRGLCLVVGIFLESSQLITPSPRPIPSAILLPIQQKNKLQRKGKKSLKLANKLRTSCRRQSIARTPWDACDAIFYNYMRIYLERKSLPTPQFIRY